ncbi:DsbA family protein [Microbacterium sp. bgisy207]|uniref:DsbA family protein n=1 Tax=Microbacterium sp. bgisy207 TaxID=3413800 RepID=UPI003EBC397B
MSSDQTPSGEQPAAPEARDRREAVREKAQKVHAKQTRARRIRAGIIGVGIVAVVAVVAVSVTWAVTSTTSTRALTPAAAKADGFPVTAVGGVVVAAEGVDDSTSLEAGATTTATPEPTPVATEAPEIEIRVYVDYLSTGSAEFQFANAPQLSTWVEEGAVSLTYYPVAMLTAKSNGTKYSLRAAAASACVATHAPEAFFAFNNALLSQQPDVDADGYSDTELADIAQASGVSSPKVVRGCIENGDFLAWAKKATERAVEEIPGTDGEQLTGTPLVLVNGSVYVGALDDPKEFAQFVLTIDSDAYYQTPTPTPTPTPTS